MERGNRRILVYRPVHVWLASALAVVLLAVAGYLLFRQGMTYAGGELERLTREQGLLQQQLHDAQAHNAALQQQLAILERSSEIDRRASLEVRDDFARLQDKMQALRKELSFYRGIVSPGDGKAGLRIQRFDLKPGATPGRYSYNLMLTQVKGNDKYARGRVEIEVKGVQDGAPRALAFDTLRVDAKRALTFKFRYFQDFAGEIEIPAGFKPHQVVVRAETRGSGQPPDVEKTLPWPD